jgi:hypothetical protein
VSDDLDTTTIRRVYKRLRGEFEGEDRRSERRHESTDWVKTLAPYVLGAAVIYGQFLVQGEKITRLEDGYKIQWQKISSHLENHE